MDYARFFDRDEEKYSMEIHPEWAQLKKKLVLKLSKVLCSMFLLLFLAFTVHKQQ